MFIDKDAYACGAGGCCAGQDPSPSISRDPNYTTQKALEDKAELDKQRAENQQTIKKVDLLTGLFSDFYWAEDAVFKTKDKIPVSSTQNQRRGRDVYAAKLYLTREGWVVEESIWENFYTDERGFTAQGRSEDPPTLTNTFKSDTFAPILERKSVFHWHRSDEVLGEIARILDKLSNDLQKATTSAALTSDMLYLRSGREGRCRIDYGPGLLPWTMGPGIMVGPSMGRYSW
jgi:hypothetical protein